MGENVQVQVRDTMAEVDLQQIKELVRGTGVFSEAEVDVAEELLLEAQRNGDSSYYKVFTAERSGCIDGYVCYAQISGTVGSYEAYWVAVRKESQGLGIGKKLMLELENRVRKSGGKRIFLGTSSRPDYKPAHRLYESAGYRRVAVLEDYFNSGDDQIVYLKHLEERLSS